MTKLVTSMDKEYTVEVAIKHLVRFLDLYKENHWKRFDTAIADDYFLGVYFKQMLEASLQLLNGDIGRLDGGDLDKRIRDIAWEGGYRTPEFDTYLVPALVQEAK